MTSPEADLLKQMNTLKQVDIRQHLTSAQKGALEEIRQHRENGEPFINLYGPRNSGKTFLCWALREHGWKYQQAHFQRVTEPDVTAVVYDHGKPDRSTTRQLRNNVDLSGLSNVVYVTKSPAKEVYPRVHLSVDEQHHQSIAANWDTLGLDTATLPSVDATVNTNSNTNQNNE
jgi:GTPase SAR1 family protein